MKGEPECSDRCPCQDSKHPMYVGFDGSRDDEWVVAYATDSGVRVLFHEDEKLDWEP